MKDSVNTSNMYYFEFDNFIITRDDNRLLISKEVRNLSSTNIFVIDIQNNKETFKISNYIYNFDGSLKSCNSYTKGEISCSLEKKEALKIAKELLDELNSIDSIKKDINLKNIYDILNLVSKKLYYPVINNDKITLSWAYRFGSTDISVIKGETLDIILNETKEKIGKISYDYQCRSGFTYGGNISYSIKEEFRSRHFATDALNLLKELLNSNKYSGDKDLYISTLPTNEHSKKVAINNGGSLIYKGSVPKEDFLSRCGIDEVYVYQIKMKHNDVVKRK